MVIDLSLTSERNSVKTGNGEEAELLQKRHVYAIRNQKLRLFKLELVVQLRCNFYNKLKERRVTPNKNWERPHWKRRGIMNIEIANRLVNLRKSNNFSQEALAEKLGISRQAVSKWERAEASPDTDNLILLARLYGVSLDELLQTEDEIPLPKDNVEVENVQEKSAEKASYYDDNKAEYVNVSFGGVHVRDKDGSEVHVGWDGIHVDDKKRRDSVHVDKNGVYVNGKKYDREWNDYRNNFPITIFVVIFYIVLGTFFNAWHPAWLLFLLIPLWGSFASAVRNKNMHIFAYPVLATLLFLCIGFFMGAWHPGWVVYLTIPLYYALVPYMQGFWDKEEDEVYDSPYSDESAEE